MRFEGREKINGGQADEKDGRGGRKRRKGGQKVEGGLRKSGENNAGIKLLVICYELRIF